MVLFLDEFADFREELGDWYPEIKQKGDPARPPVIRRLRSVARKGRTARVHFVVGLQRPDAEFLSGEVRDNFSARISMGRLSPQRDDDVGERRHRRRPPPAPPAAAGPRSTSSATRASSGVLDPPDPRNTGDDKLEDRAILDALHPDEVTHERMMILEPPRQPNLDDAKDASEQPSYTDIATARIVRYDPKVARDGGADFLPAPQPAMSAARVEPESADAVDDLFAGYSEPRSVGVDRLSPGDLLLVDEPTDEWGLVEEVDVDLLDEDSYAIDYTDFETGDSRTVSLSQSSSVLVRRPEGVAS